MPVQIRGLTSSVSNQGIGNILDGSDDTYWMSNGSGKPVISMDLDGHAEFVFLDFQRGFQPRIIRTIERASTGVHESTVDVARADSRVEIPVQSMGSCHMDIVLEESYDPYGRVCIYTLDAKERNRTAEP